MLKIFFFFRKAEQWLLSLKPCLQLELWHHLFTSLLVVAATLQSQWLHDCRTGHSPFPKTQIMFLTIIHLTAMLPFSRVFLNYLLILAEYNNRLFRWFTWKANFLPFFTCKLKLCFSNEPTFIGIHNYEENRDTKILS